MRSDSEIRNKTKWCNFHKDHGHHTEECKALKDMLEDLIREGQLNKFGQNPEGQAPW